MPRGFDNIPSGRELPARLQDIIQAFQDRLVWETSSTKPKTAKQMCSDWDFGIPLTDVDIRALVSHLCVEKDCPIASQHDGYFWALKPEELDATVWHLTDRELRIRSHRIAIEDAQRRMRDGTEEPQLPF